MPLLVPKGVQIHDLHVSGFVEKDSHFQVSPVGAATKLFDKDPNADDFCQGCIGNCFFLASVTAVLTRKNGPQLIKDMFEEDRPDRTHIVGRMYDSDQRSFYMRVPKALIRVKEGNGPYEPLSQKDPLWLSALGLFYTAFAVTDAKSGDVASKKISFDPKNANLERLHGGNSWLALQGLLGTGTTTERISDTESISVHFEVDGVKYALMGAAWSQAARTLYGVLCGADGLKDDILQAQGQKKSPERKAAKTMMSMLNDAHYHSHLNTVFGHDSNTKKMWQEKQDEIFELWGKALGAKREKHKIRLSEFQDFAMKLTPLVSGRAVQALVHYARKNRIFLEDGKRGSGVYSPRTLDLFYKIQNALLQGKAVVADARPYAGVSTAADKAGGCGEGVAKGLAGGHSYAVVNTKTVGSIAGGRPLCWVQLINPWRDEVVRGYDLSDKNPNYLKAVSGLTRTPVDPGWLTAQAVGTNRAADPQGVFWLELSDLAKRFNRINIAHKKLR